MKTEQLLCWTDTEHSTTSGLNEDPHTLYVGFTIRAGTKLKCYELGLGLGLGNRLN